MSLLQKLSSQFITPAKDFVELVKNARKSKEEVDTLYKLLYDRVHDLDESLDLSSKQTREAFSFQWEELPEGKFLLTDPWFKEHVTNILCEEEIQIRPEWFQGKRVLDAGCGNGRWSYALAKLGADVTAVDVNDSAIEKTKQALAPFDVEKRFIKAPLEDIDSILQGESFDLVFSWGVLHHCARFNKAFENVQSLCRDGGLLYLYLYGRESLPMEADLRLFKERVQYNTLAQEDRIPFLLDKVGGDRMLVHGMHDCLSPLVNRRFDFEYVAKRLTDLGYTDVCRTLDHTELFVRAVKGPHGDQYADWFLPRKSSPFWFER